MLHGRVVRPPEVGATVGSVDERSIRELPGIVKVVVKGNFVGVVAQKPWQAMQGAERLNVSWTRGTPLSPHTDLYSELRKQPARDTLLVDSGDVDARLAAASTVLRVDLSPPLPDARLDRQLVRGGGCARRQGDALVGNAVGVSDAEHVGDAARAHTREHPCHLRARRRLLRPQWSRHGHLRRRVALTSRRPARSRAALAQGRDGVGELRQRVRHRSARGARSRRQHQRLGLRGVVGRARRPAWLQHARQRRHRLPRRVRVRRRSLHGRPLQRPPRRSTTDPTPLRRISPAACAIRRAPA